MTDGRMLKKENVEGLPSQGPPMLTQRYLDVPHPVGYPKLSCSVYLATIG